MMFIGDILVKMHEVGMPLHELRTALGYTDDPNGIANGNRAVAELSDSLLSQNLVQAMYPFQGSLDYDNFRGYPIVWDGALVYVDGELMFEGCSAPSGDGGTVSRPVVRGDQLHVLPV